MKTAILWALCFCAAAALADKVVEPTKPMGPRIVREAISNQPTGDFRLKGRLILTGKEGRRTTLGLVIFTKPSETTTKTIFGITQPPETAGAALLLIQSFDEPNQIYYRSAGADAAVRVTAQNGSERFMDTALSYEDLNFSFLRWANQEWLREEKRVGRWCDVIRGKPASEDDSQYAYVLSWIDKEGRAPLVVEGYDINGRLIKSVIVKGFMRSGGGWTIKEMVVTDYRAGQTTRLIIDKGDFKTKLPETLFCPESFFNESEAWGLR